MTHLPLAGLNLNLLVALDALLETRSVRRAAERSGVTQSAMSHSLRQLRELFEDALLVRSGNDMLPTPRAQELALPLHQALASLSHLLEGGTSFVPARSSRRFVVATTDALAVSLFPALVDEVRQKAPEVELSFVPAASDRLEAQLVSGEVDLAVGMVRERPGVEREELFDAPFVVLSRKEHPGIKRRLDLDTYCRLPHALVVVTGQGGGAVDEALARMGRSRRVVLRVPYFLAAPALLAKSDLLLTLPRVTAVHFTERYPLSLHEPPLELPGGSVAMGWHERYGNDAGLEWLRGRVRMAAKSVTGRMASRHRRARR